MTTEDDDDMTDASSMIDFASVRGTYTRDEVDRMRFVLTVNHNQRDVGGEWKGATARWTVTLDGNEIGLGYSPYRCPYIHDVVRELLTGREPSPTQYLNPWDWSHGESEWIGSAIEV